MSISADDEKLIRLLKKIKVEETQQISRNSRIENILRVRLQGLDRVTNEIESVKKYLVTIENNLSMAVFAEGKGAGLEFLSRRKLEVRARIIELEAEKSEHLRGVKKAREHLEVSQTELQDVISSRKTAEQLLEKKNIAKYLLREQEEENQLEEVHGRRMEDLASARLRK